MKSLRAVLCILLAIMLPGLSACGGAGESSLPPQSPMEADSSVEELPSTPEESEPAGMEERSQEPEAYMPEEPAREDYLAVLEDLKAAFATGEYQAFVDQYPYTGYIDPGYGPFLNEWPALLEGVTAQATYNVSEVQVGDGWCETFMHLMVSGGNEHLPEGQQRVALRLEAITQGPEPPSESGLFLYHMMLETDQRWRYNKDIRYVEMDVFEEQIYHITNILSRYANTPLSRTIRFLDVFEGNAVSAYFEGEYTEAEIVAGAKKYLGIDYSPVGETLWFDDVPQNEPREGVALTDDGRYYIVGIGLGWPTEESYLLLNSPTEGDLTCRVFTYADDFLLKVDHVTDYSYLILQNEDGTSYARLLSIQTVEAQ